MVDEGDELIRIDPRRNRVVARIKVPGANALMDVAAGEGGPWVLDRTAGVPHSDLSRRAQVSRSPRWLVDGMNVVGSRPDGWWRDRRGSMERLVALLEDFAAETGEKVAVVFDGRPFPLETGAVDVAFSPEPGRNAADREIAARVERDGDRASLRVVTSDGDLAATVSAAGARVVPAGGFRRRLDGGE